MANYDETDRDKAYKRADKIANLFLKAGKKDNFQKIMATVDPVPNVASFVKACNDAGLTNANEVNWLWTYLQNCNAAVYGAVPEAASSGW